jgi:hypothetical protein
MAVVMRATDGEEATAARSDFRLPNECFMLTPGGRVLTDRCYALASTAVALAVSLVPSQLL